MKKHLNTLFVTTQGAYLAKEGETVVVKIEQEARLRIPVHTIGGIVCFGTVSLSPFLMGFCAENGVGISFLSEQGRFLARVQGPVSGNVLLRREQYRRADDMKFSAGMAKAVVAGKLANCRTVLQRALRDHTQKMDANQVDHTVKRLNHNLNLLNQEQPLDVVRGIEGDATHSYFSVFDQLLSYAKEMQQLRQKRRKFRLFYTTTQNSLRSRHLADFFRQYIHQFDLVVGAAIG